jgi:hypothetical protein
MDEHPTAKGICVCRATRPYRIGTIECLPWQDFLNDILPE